jgi:hypothetical protein
MIILSAPSARAQNGLSDLIRENDETAYQRTPEEYQPPPVHYRGFVIKPVLNVTSEYTDNVFLSGGNEQSDFTVETAPHVSITKHYRDHLYQLDVQAKDRRYLDFDQENSTNFLAKLKTRLQATKALRLPFELSFRTENVDRKAAGETVLAAITQYDAARASAGFDYRFNRLNVQMIGHYERRNFENGRALGTAAPILFEAKDRNEYGASLIGTYDLASDHALFAGIRYTQQDFDSFTDSSNVDTSGLRSNDGIHFLAGLKTRYKNLLIGDIGVGYILQDYESPAADSIGSFDISADLDYLVTPKLTVNLQASREINQDNDVVQGVLKSRFLLGFEYEFLTDLYGRAETFYEDYDFIDSTREEDVLGGAVNLRWLHSPLWESQLGLSYQIRESNAAERDYNQMIGRYGLIRRF